MFLKIDKYLHFNVAGTLSMFEKIKDGKRSEMRERTANARLFLTDALRQADMFKGRIRGSKWILLKYVIDYITIGVAYSKTEKQDFKYTPYQYPKAIKELTNNKKDRIILKSILSKLQTHIHASKKIISRDYIPLLKIIAKTNKFNKDFIIKFNFELEELKYLGCKITPKKYELMIK
jgi:hypothetical protein